MSGSEGAAGSDNSDPAPVRRRSRDERGLPDRQVLIDLARTYLKEQAKLWPELRKAGIIPSPTPETLAAMAAEFEQRFLAGKLVFVKAPCVNGIAVDLAASYLRCSDNNSNARSLAQQLQLQLRKAHYQFYV
jgi:hypothetical protein